MKEAILKALKFLASLVTDKDWDGDPAKVCGIALMVIGVIGFFCGIRDFQWVIGFGAGMIASGKFSSQG